MRLEAPTINLTTFLMFPESAEEALRFYVSALPGSSIESLTRYGAGEAGNEGSVKLAAATLEGTKVLAIDSPAKHAFTFTPSISFFVDVESAGQLEALAAAHGEGEMELTPIGDYGFSQSFTWVQDRWGISWQLNWP